MNIPLHYYITMLQLLDSVTTLSLNTIPPGKHATEYTIGGLLIALEFQRCATRRGSGQIKRCATSHHMHIRLWQQKSVPRIITVVTYKYVPT